MRTCLDIFRARKLTLHTRPPVLSFKYLRLWRGALKIFFQFISAHKHHQPAELARARDLGPPPAGPVATPPPAAPPAPAAITLQA
jgi:hypothetical protein